ncbi:MAG TPA: hypothetical protein VLW65_03180 [Bryobacteraceae bacterium]|nr:hypothetical protein [Bryobacteraceae bacterium]
MAFQWLQMRISEELDRRQREETIHSMLPGALEDLHRQLAECIAAYRTAFGSEVADIRFFAGKIRVTTREPQNGKWEPASKVEVTAVTALPGFKVERGSGDPLLIEVGLLPGSKLCYRSDDQYLTLEEMTRRILDRALFPKLKE